MKFDVSKLKAAIAKRPQTGTVVEADSLVRPSQRPDNLPGQGRIGAVMIMLFANEANESPSFVLTRRRNDLKHHPGQISLPGGRQEDGESLQRTAARETQEEIGIDANHLEILGQLDPVYIPPSDFTISAFVGWYVGPPQFTPQESEVAELIEANLDWLCHEDAVKFGEIIGAGGGSAPIRSQYLDLDSRQVWGATAKILLDFRMRLIASLQS